MVGETLGRYEILAPLGAGGMGEVYRARDPKLKRDIAIKVLPEEMSSDAERRERFEREAVAIAALDHPNIVTVYSVEEANGRHFITMQLVEGTTLAESIPRRGMTTDKYFKAAVALADAIAAAHERGIAHRDLKPSNVMLTPEGAVKVLDFGLAKLLDAGDAGMHTDSEARTAFETVDAGDLLTEEGKILGTVAYMSPEQAEGKPVDHRSDIFSLGIILYEMATGERPFVGDSKLSVMSSIVRDEPPPITELNTTLPRHLGRIVKHALEKDVKKRFQSALDLKNELAELADEVESGEALPVSALPAANRTGLRPVHVAAAVGVIAAAVLAYAAWGPGSDDSSGETVWRTVRLTNLPGVERYASISADGDELVYAGDAAGNLDVYLQKVDGANPINLTPGSAANDSQPALGPDGRIVFRSEREPPGIYIMGPTGENQRLLVAEGFEPKWSNDGTRVAYSTTVVNDPRSLGGDAMVTIIDVASGQTRALAPGYQPAWSPSGRRIAFMALSAGARDLWTIDANGDNAVQLTADPYLDWSPVWSPDGRFVYFASDRGGADNVWGLAVDEQTGEALSAPEPVTSGGSNEQGFLSVSGDGNRIVYTSSSRRANIQRIGFDPVSEAVVGAPVDITRGDRNIPWFDVSPDGTRVVFGETFPQEDIFTIGANGEGEFRVTDDLFRDRRPRWSPNGDRIAMYSDRDGAYDSWTLDPDGGSPVRQTALGGVLDVTWSPDGHRLALFVRRRGGYLVDATRSFDEQTPIALPVSEQIPALFRPTGWSPDGRRLAGFQEVSGGVWVHAIDAQTYEQISGFGSYPHWLADSSRLIFTAYGVIWLTNVDSGETKELLNLSPDGVTEPKTLVSDGNRTIYFVRVENRADIYLLAREE